jgi:hypothetical protein
LIVLPEEKGCAGTYFGRAAVRTRRAQVAEILKKTAPDRLVRALAALDEGYVKIWYFGQNETRAMRSFTMQAYAQAYAQADERFACAWWGANYEATCMIYTGYFDVQRYRCSCSRGRRLRNKSKSVVGGSVYSNHGVLAIFNSVTLHGRLGTGYPSTNDTGHRD